MTFVLLADRLPLPQGLSPIKSVEFLQPGASGEGKRVTLPDNWRNDPQRAKTTGQYRTSFDYPENAEQWSIFIPRYSGGLKVSINGLALPTGDLFAGQMVPDQSLPYIALIPHQYLKPTGNMVRIELASGGLLVGFLDPVYVGPDRLLQPSHAWHYFRYIRGPVLIAFWQLLLSVMLLMLWLSRPQEKAALYISVFFLFASMHMVPVYLPQVSDFSSMIAKLAHVTNFWQAVLALLFVYSLNNTRPPLPALYFFIIPTIASLSYLTLPTDWFEIVLMTLVVPFSLILTGWITVLVGYYALWKGKWESHLLLASSLGGVAMAIYDTMILSNSINDSNSLHSNVAMLIFLPSISIIFLQRLIQSLNQVDSLVGSLEARIEEKESELHASFDQRRRLVQNQALTEERQRIMRDVHDGLGGQLMSIIAMSRTGLSDPETIEQSARSALDELRMMIGSLAVENDITGMLGTFRERAEQQLALAGIELDWRMTDIPAIEGMTPAHALNVLRILQEATTNASKHSGADKLSIRFALVPELEKPSLSGISSTMPGSVERQRLKIEIEDNGRGYRPQTINGHGFANMQLRAHALQGSLDIEPSAEGCRILFTMPLDLSSGPE